MSDNKPVNSSQSPATPHPSSSPSTIGLFSSSVPGTETEMTLEDFNILLSKPEVKNSPELWSECKNEIIALVKQEQTYEAQQDKARKYAAAIDTHRSFFGFGQTNTRKAIDSMLEKTKRSETLETPWELSYHVSKGQEEGIYLKDKATKGAHEENVAPVTLRK